MAQSCQQFIRSSDSTTEGAAAGTTTGCPVTMVYLDLLPTVFVFIEFYCWLDEGPRLASYRPADSKTALQKSYKNYYLSAIG